MIPVEKAVHTVSSCKYHKSGVDCQFFKYDNKFGIKVFYQKEKRDYSYCLQKIASFHGYAPKCYGRFSIPDACGARFAFVTEAVECTLEDKYGTMSSKTGEEYGNIAFLHHKKHPLHSLWEAMDKIGIRVYDSHHRNYGVLNGKPVCIDFGSPGYHVGYKGKRHKYPICNASSFDIRSVKTEYNLPEF